MTISLLLLLQERGGRLNAKKRYMLTRQTQLPLEDGFLLGNFLENGTLNKYGFVGGFGFCFFFLSFFFEAPSCSAKTDDDRRPTWG